MNLIMTRNSIDKVLAPTLLAFPQLFHKFLIYMVYKLPCPGWLKVPHK